MSRDTTRKKSANNTSSAPEKQVLLPKDEKQGPKTETNANTGGGTTTSSLVAEAGDDEKRTSPPKTEELPRGTALQHNATAANNKLPLNTTDPPVDKNDPAQVNVPSPANNKVPLDNSQPPSPHNNPSADNNATQPTTVPLKAPNKNGSPRMRYNDSLKMYAATAKNKNKKDEPKYRLPPRRKFGKRVGLNGPLYG